MLKTTKIKDILYEKEPPLVNLKDSLAHARNIGIRYKRKTIIVADDREKPVGILSLHEIGEILMNKPFYATPIDRLVVSNFMKKELYTALEEDFLVDVARKILDKKMEIVIVDKEGVVVGLLEAEDLIGPYSRLSESEGIIDEVYRRDPPIAYSLHSIGYAYDIMKEKDADAVIVIDQLKRPVGIITYSDIAYLPFNYFLKKSKYIKSRNRVLYVKYSLPVLEDIMSSPVYVTYPYEKLINAARQMYLQRIGHLPVVDENNRVIGIIDKYVILDDILREGL